jgi:hypothetical protein
MSLRRHTLVCGLIAMTVAGTAGCGGATLTELQRVKSGTTEVVLLSPRDALRHGKDDFMIEFRNSSGGLVDVGAVRASANMPMAGTPMLASVDIRRTDTPGRYAATSDFSMAGTWRLGIEWDGPAGRGSVSFAGSVQ